MNSLKDLGLLLENGDSFYKVSKDTKFMASMPFVYYDFVVDTWLLGWKYMTKPTKPYARYFFGDTYEEAFDEASKWYNSLETYNE